MRAPSDTDFHIDVEGTGRFRLGRRTFGDRIRIRAEFLRLTGGYEGDVTIDGTAAMVAAFKVLCVSAPPGWEDFENIDLTQRDQDEVEAKLFELYAKLREKEDSFRLRPHQASEGGRARDGADDGVLVPPQVRAQPA